MYLDIFSYLHLKPTDVEYMHVQCREPKRSANNSNFKGDDRTLPPKDYSMPLKLGGFPNMYVLDRTESDLQKSRVRSPIDPNLGLNIHVSKNSNFQRTKNIASEANELMYTRVI